MAKSKSHYYVPERADKYMDNRPACCDRPAADHPAFVDGSTVQVALRRDFRRLNGQVVAKGTVVTATRSHYLAMRTIRPSRWGTNELGQFAEIDRGEYEDVQVPGYSIRFDGDSHLTGLGLNHVKEL